MMRTLHTDELHLCDYKLNPGDCVWYNDGEFMIADELGRLSTMRVQKFVLDLSPLQKFMGKRGEFWVEVENGQGLFGGDFDFPRALDTLREYQERARVRIENNSQSIAIIQGVWLEPGQSAMYGMDYDFGWVPPASPPEPEKSSLDKALEDFVAKRKAKREGVGGFEVGQHDRDAAKRIDRYAKEVRDGQALDRAMRRLSFHEQDIHTRLMPYRREE